MKAKNYLNNQTLITSLQKEDEDAYAFLVDSYHHGLCVYAFNLIKDMDMAHDIVQNVFIKVWEKRQELNPRLSLKSLLYRSVYNEFIDQYRKNQAIHALEKKYVAALNTYTYETDPELFTRLVSATKKGIENLPPRCKEVFILSKEEGLSNREISEYLGISIKTVEAQITKAFSILRDKIGKKIEILLFLIFGKKMAEHTV